MSHVQLSQLQAGAGQIPLQQQQQMMQQVQQQAPQYFNANGVQSPFQTAAGQLPGGMGQLQQPALQAAMAQQALAQQNLQSAIQPGPPANPQAGQAVNQVRTISAPIRPGAENSGRCVAPEPCWCTNCAAKFEQRLAASAVQAATGRGEPEPEPEVPKAPNLPIDVNEGTDQELNDRLVTLTGLRYLARQRIVQLRPFKDFEDLKNRVNEGLHRTVRLGKKQLGYFTVGDPRPTPKSQPRKVEDLRPPRAAAPKLLKKAAEPHLLRRGLLQLHGQDPCAASALAADVLSQYERTDANAEEDGEEAEGEGAIDPSQPSSMPSIRNARRAEGPHLLRRGLLQLHGQDPYAASALAADLLSRWDGTDMASAPASAIQPVPARILQKSAYRPLIPPPNAAKPMRRHAMGGRSLRAQQAAMFHVQQQLLMLQQMQAAADGAAPADGSAAPAATAVPM